MGLDRRQPRPLCGTRFGFAVAVLLFATSIRASAQTFDMSDFFTPRLGDYWNYRLNGAQLVTSETIEFSPAGSVHRMTTKWTGGPLDGTESQSRFDPAVGVELLSNFQPSIFIDGVGFVDQLQEFSPPVLAAPAVFTIGDVVHSSTGLMQTFSNASGSVSLSGTATATYRFAFWEPIQVPFGLFDALQRQIQIDIALEVEPGQWEEVHATSRDWLVPGLGAVRIEQIFPHRTDVYELVDTNRVFVPEPQSALPGFVAAACVLLLRQRRQVGNSRY